MSIFGWVLVAFGLLAGAVSLATVVGSFLPRARVASRSMTLHQSPEAIWSTLRDSEKWPEWWKLIKSVERQTDRDGHETIRVTYTDGNRFALEKVEADAPRRLILQIGDAVFSGRWEYDLAPTGDGGTCVTLTEHGEIAQPFVRLMARLAMNPTMYLDIHLKALAEKFGEPAELR